MTLLARAVNPAEIKDDYAETAAALIVNHEAGQYSELQPIAADDFPKTLRKIRVALASKGHGLTVKNRTEADGAVTVTVAVGALQKRGPRKPSEAAPKALPKAGKVAETVDAPRQG